MATVLVKLNVLADEVSNQIERVNNGGCAVYAAHVGYHLKYIRGLKDVVLRVGDYCSDDGNRSIESFRKKVKSNAAPRDWNRAGVYFGHVILEFRYRGKLYHYDSAGGVVRASDVTVLNEYPLYDGHMTVEEGLAIASVSEGWNKMFDRKQIPKLIKLINEHLG
jgi:hypothetical protein